MRKDTELALEALARSFSVADLMVPWEHLVRADSIEQAQVIFDTYDFVPYPQRGPIRGWFRKDLGNAESVNPAMLLSDSVSVLDLPKYLAARPAYMIWQGNAVGGLVHFSDLNSPLMKLPLFVLFEAVESELIAALNFVATEEMVRSVLSPKRTREVMELRMRLQRQRSELGWAQGLFFGELLALATKCRVLQLPPDEVRSLTDLRNKVAHADRMLLEAGTDAAQLEGFRIAFDQLTSVLETLPSPV